MDAPPPIPTSRHPAAVAAAIFHAWTPFRWRGYAAGFFAGVVGGGIVAPVVTTTLTLVAALLGVIVEGQFPWAEFTWTLVFAIVSPLAGALAYAQWQPRDLRDAAQTYLWLAQAAETRWRAATGLPTVPRDEAGMREFLRTVAPTPENAGERFGIWITLLDVEQARSAIAEMPDGSAYERFGHASAAWLAAFVAEGAAPPASFEELEVLASQIEDPGDRREARVTVALQRARAAVAAGGDWRAPLAAVRSELAREPDPVYARVVWRPAFRQLLIACLIGIFVYWASWLMLAPYFHVAGALL